MEKMDNILILATHEQHQEKRGLPGSAGNRVAKEGDRDAV